MIEIKHKTAAFRVLPENAQKPRDLLGLIDKSSGKRGMKIPREKPVNRAERDMAKWFYPMFTPGMATMEYVRQYEHDNVHRQLSSWQYDCADRPAPMLDPNIPEVLEEAYA